MSDSSANAVLILGMHRSGTSYLARLLQESGVFIGDRLVGPQRGNPRGHFEAEEFLAFHQRLIQERRKDERRAFDEDLLVQAPLEEAFSAAEAEEAERLLGKLRRSGLYGWKEPRTCLFLSAWRQLLPDARSVVVFRHPLEVHQSLLRRGHWDLALFPDQAMRAYQVFNDNLLTETGERSFFFSANAGYADVATLAKRLAGFLETTPPASLPAFHAGEFTELRISRALHDLFCILYPDTGAVFDRLQERAEIPFVFAEREDDPWIREQAERLEPLLRELSPEGRAFFGPCLDWMATGKDEAVFGGYAELAREIGEEVRKVLEWNREAEEFYRENERLAAENERLGTLYAEQQEFLAKQTKTQEEVWADLERVGKSWEKQKEQIIQLLAEKRERDAELVELRKRVRAFEDASS
jgi:regulator of replication initiation timing